MGKGRSAFGRKAGTAVAAAAAAAALEYISRRCSRCHWRWRSAGEMGS